MFYLLSGRSGVALCQSVHSGLTMREILNICVMEKFDRDKVSKSVPSPASNSVFIVDLSSVYHKDLMCDDSGVYDRHSSPTAVVKADFGDCEVVNMQTVCRRTVNSNEPLLEESGVFVIKRYYSVRDDPNLGKLTRIITRVYKKVTYWNTPSSSTSEISAQTQGPMRILKARKNRTYGPNLV